MSGFYNEKWQIIKTIAIKLLGINSLFNNLDKSRQWFDDELKFIKNQLQTKFG